MTILASIAKEEELMQILQNFRIFHMVLTSIIYDNARPFEPIFFSLSSCQAKQLFRACL